ncbi:MAG: ribosome biogenesis GTPase YlqF [Tissierellia bacterium]|nr:ribosome biogenesis GTPase YlqF [Tissierellia bacterium]
MNINWYPGHMKKTLEKIEENSKQVDFVIEILDARIPISSQNPEINKLLEGKPRLVLLNKKDLAQAEETTRWIQFFEKEREGEALALAWNSQDQASSGRISQAVKTLMAPRMEKLRAKGIKKIKHRGMVVGIPNVGKSTFINQIAGRKAAKIGNRPGVTKSNQWIRLHPELDLMDTPGVLWPKLDPPIRAYHLAFTGSIKDEVMDRESLALEYLKEAQAVFPQALLDRYKLEDFEKTPLETLEAIGKKRGALVAGGYVDYSKVANLLLDEFRKGLLGPLSLERVGDHDRY